MLYSKCGGACLPTPLQRVSDLVVLADSCHAMGDNWRFAWPNAPGSYSTSPRKCDNARNIMNPDWARHMGGDNFVFADGHAKWLEATAFYGKWSSTYGYP